MFVARQLETVEIVSLSSNDQMFLLLVSKKRTGEPGVVFPQACRIPLPRWWWMDRASATPQTPSKAHWTLSGISTMTCESAPGPSRVRAQSLIWCPPVLTKPCVWFLVTSGRQTPSPSVYGTIKRSISGRGRASWVASVSFPMPSAG